MNLIEMVDEVNKETEKLNSVANLIAGCDEGFDKEIKNGLVWLISDSADRIKELVNDCQKKKVKKDG
ncbi:MAG: hypothetical protein FD145_909 [Candidatus Saganbacteria bacterium]|uniref:Uncharacterized protein n=1 Tax=Candidatus Saganbacteria bacterium TaxID=2575572 RepID=A0A833P341_UNCSA|nr:MAG: hypothetical protein FD145_909 [Candidatus Saganbacteria bacterium]